MEKINKSGSGAPSIDALPPIALAATIGGESRWRSAATPDDLGAANVVVCAWARREWITASAPGCEAMVQDLAGLLAAERAYARRIEADHAHEREAIGRREALEEGKALEDALERERMLLRRAAGILSDLQALSLRSDVQEFLLEYLKDRRTREGL